MAYVWNPGEEADIASFMDNSTYLNYYDSNNDTLLCGSDTTQAFRRYFLPPFYILIFLLGLCGNVMVIAVLLRAKESLPGTDVFILHLAVADVLLVLTLPFWAVQAVHSWVFGDVMCKMVGSVFKINFYASIFFLVCISFDRYLSIVYVIRMYNRGRSSLILLSSLVVWVLCILLTLPDFIYLTSEPDSRQNTTSCTLNFPPGSSSAKFFIRIFSQLLAFFLPLVAMTCCYIRIILSLMNSKGSKKNKAFRVILAVVVVFFLCWTPYHLVEFIENLIDFNALQKDCEWEAKLDMAETVTTSLGFFHCCLNPLLYAFVGVKFQNRFLSLLESFGCVSHAFLQRHARSSSHRRDSTWSESTEASYSGL
ncbi:C-X-C chemokine receptor type 3 [Podarcis raffonei]|uniref:C-X-C chemokine receptor type 3 n=1 Tax=Podarcis raffonei TaxID=65483 RepID=UPI0023296816|nr:C-X-C chemokine receptor type 3 [Podarcis raffonei]